MNVIDITQRSDDWFQWRAEGVTASEAAIVLGRSPYKTAWRLWAERTGVTAPEDLSAKPCVQRGIALEDQARQGFEERHSTILLPLCAESDEHPVLRASFDGIDADGSPVELKVPVDNALAQWQQAATAYRELAAERRDLEDSLKRIKERMKQTESAFVAMMGDFLLADTEGVRVTRYLQNGAIDYKALLHEWEAPIRRAIEPANVVGGRLRFGYQLVRIAPAEQPGTLEEEVEGLGNGIFNEVGQMARARSPERSPTSWRM